MFNVVVFMLPSSTGSKTIQSVPKEAATAKQLTSHKTD